ncbi:MAG: type IX secretion system membrane protein PorP/SprF [Bacteroidetes bacterium]|nr:type IX secretion system membrane protein PorP/SprF [Bacteroidota bacterium]
MKRFFSIIALGFLSIGFANAQNDIMFTHYMFNESIFNPAMVGSTPNLETAIVARQQWVGFDNAPSTQMIKGNAYFDQVQGGVGLHIINDRIGYESALNLKISYAYFLKLDEKSKLSFGLGFGFLNKSVEGSKLTYDEVNDPYAVTTNSKAFRADFDFGAAFTSKNFSTGLSVTHISQSLKKSSILKVPRNYYFFIKNIMNVNDKIDVVPSMVIRSSIYITQFDLNAILYYDKKFYGGIGYRLNDAMIGTIGVNITKDIKFGYSYDFGVGAVKTHSGGTHEIMLSAAFKGFSKESNRYPSFLY